MLRSKLIRIALLVGIFATGIVILSRANGPALETAVRQNALAALAPSTLAQRSQQPPAPTKGVATNTATVNLLEAAELSGKGETAVSPYASSIENETLRSPAEVEALRQAALALKPNFALGQTRPQGPGLTAPIPGVGFEALEVNDCCGGGTSVPPDPEMAAGSNHLIAVVNVAIEVYDKTGTSVVGPITIDDFFAPLGGTNCTAGGTFDPNTLYDEKEDRYIIAADGAGNAYCVAVSQTSNPVGIWNLYEFPTNVGGNFFDYPHAGVGENAIFMGGNMFGTGFVEGRVWAFDKHAMYAGDVNPAFVTHSTGDDDTPQPIRFHGFNQGTWPSSATHHILTSRNYNGKTYELWSWADPFGTDVLTDEATLDIAAAHGTAVGMPLASPQLGGGQTLDSVDFRPLDFEYRNGSGWMATTVSCNPGSGTVNCIQWAEINLAGESIVQAGVIASNGQYRFLPDIAANSCGDAAVGYTKSSTSIYPSVFITGREVGDAAGTMQAEVLVKAGEVNYTSFDGSPARWGDYTGMTIDPDGQTFWYLGEYSENSTNTDAKWGTYITSATFPVCSGVTGADVRVTKSGDVDPVAPGGTLVYTIEVTNNGPDDATGVSFSDPLPADVAYVSNTCSASYNSGSHTLSRTIGNMVVGANLTCEVTVTVDENAPGLISNTATVVSDDDFNDANDSATAETSVVIPDTCASYTGTNIDGPEWDRPIGTGPSISSLGPVRYHAYKFQVTVTGSYDIASVQDYDGYLHLYANGFDPVDQLVGLFAAADDGPGGIGTSNLNAVTLSAGTDYYLITSAFEFGEEGEFENEICGPGLAYQPVFVYVSAHTNGTVGGVSYAREDILLHEQSTNSWSLYFDGSDMGFGGRNLDGFELLADGTILMSFDVTNLAVPGVGTVERSDIIRFHPTSLGTTTQGSFSLVLDGSDVDLTSTSEAIDGITVDDNGRIIFSTRSGMNAGGVTAADEDLVAFNASNLGDVTVGTFEVIFDGSTVGFTNDVNAVWTDGTTWALSPETNVNLPNGLRANDEDVFGFDGAYLPDLLFDGSTVGFTPRLDEVSFGRRPVPVAGGSSGEDADLVVVASDTPDPATVGEMITYDIEVYNDGPDTAVNTFFVSDLDEKVTYISATASQGSCTPIAPNTTAPSAPSKIVDRVECDLGNIGGGQSAFVTLVAQAIQDGNTTNGMTASSDSNETDPSDNSSTVVTAIAAGPDISRQILYLSSSDNGTINGLSYKDEDVLAYYVDSDTWAIFFDGSVEGVDTDVDGLHINDDGTMLMSFDRRTFVPGVGNVEASDIVTFDPATGLWTLFFVGAAHDLTTADENVDAIGLDSSGNLIVSTSGKATVNGTALQVEDEDLILYDGATWWLVMDGSAVGNTADTDALWMADDTTAFLSLDASKTLPGGVSVRREDVVSHDLAGGGYDPALVFDGSVVGFTRNLDALSVGAFAAPPNAICSTPGTTITTAGNVSYSDTISVSDAGTVADLDVYLDISHTWVGDLSITLNHVGGSGPATILNRPGRAATGFGCSNNDILATINDEGADGNAEAMCNGTPPALFGDLVGGDPAGPVMSTFDGDTIAGDWVLTITDNEGGDGGTFNEWCVVFTSN